MKTTIIKAGYGYKLFAVAAIQLILFTGCKKYLNIPLPVDRIAGSGAYLSDASTGGVLSGTLYNITNSGLVAGSSGIGFQTGLYMDELDNFDTRQQNTNVIALYTDNISYTNVAYWTPLYKQIYTCNLAIEGIQASTTLTSNKNQFLGEAYFLRAWLYFNLVNLYGDVPLALSSDPTTNNQLPRTPKAQVYQQIIADLQQARTLLPVNNYLDGSSIVTTANRARPNSAAASALLARTYLYMGDWANAEAQATVVINNTATYQMVPLAQTFLSSSREVIWGLTPTGANAVGDYGTYNNNVPATIVPPNTILTNGLTVSLSTSQVNNFEANDGRFANWVFKVTVPGTVKPYYFPYKYKSSVNGTETIVVLRLAEQYLIRAEARANQGNVSGAQSDLNAVRTRAGLGATTAATQTDLLNAILKERRSEFFTELGMRYFDLKRTGNSDAVMNVIAPLKGGTWSAYKNLFPISPTDILVDPAIIQNPGYK